MVDGFRYYRALESVSIASALSTALTIYPCQIRVHQVIHAHGGSEEDIKARIATAWKNGKSYQECCVIEECPLVLKEKYIEQW